VKLCTGGRYNRPPEKAWLDFGMVKKLSAISIRREYVPRSIPIKRFRISVAFLIVLLAGCSSIFEPSVSPPAPPFIDNWVEPPEASITVALYEDF
jgi:hypothetical protein